MLPLIALFLGLAIFIKHLMALLLPEPFKAFIQRFPRSSFFGKLLLISAAFWAFTLAVTTDLGEFSTLRTPILIGIIVGSGLFGWLVSEFLAVRSLGFIMLLAARPLLELTFLKSGLLPLLLSFLAYIWIIIGLLSVGMPYLLRNAITFLVAPQRQQLWRYLCYAGLLYGLLLLINGAWQVLMS